MVTHEDTYLVDNNSANQVNDGRNIKLNCTGITFDLNAFVATPQLPGKSITTQTHNEILASSDWVGIDNPTMVVDGTVEVIKADQATEPDSETVTLKLLQQVIKSGHIFKLYDYWDTDAERFRIHSLEGTFPEEQTAIIYVRATNLHVSTSPSEGAEGRILTYNLTLREVKNE